MNQTANDLIRQGYLFRDGDRIGLTLKGIEKGGELKKRFDNVCNPQIPLPPEETATFSDHELLMIAAYRLHLKHGA